MTAGQQTVLIVDDESPIRRLVETILASEGYRTLSAQDGAQALEVSRSHAGPIHLLLSDVVMPRMDGVALCNQIAAERPEAAILLMSGHHDESEVPPDLTFIPKPFTAEQLLLRIRQSLKAAEAVNS